MLQQLTERFCKPVLLYNLAADKLSNRRIEYAWNAMGYDVQNICCLMGTQ